MDQEIQAAFHSQACTALKLYIDRNHNHYRMICILAIYNSCDYNIQSNIIPSVTDICRFSIAAYIDAPVYNPCSVMETFLIKESCQIIVTALLGFLHCLIKMMFLIVIVKECLFERIIRHIQADFQFVFTESQDQRQINFFRSELDLRIPDDRHILRHSERK